MTAGDVVATNICSLEARQGASFDGTDDYILADAHAVARVAGNDTVGTYSAWIYLDALGNEECLLSAGDNDSATEYFQIVISSNGRLYTKLQHGAATQFQVTQVLSTADQAITPKKWTYVAVVQDGIQPALYINGRKISTSNTTATDLTYWYDELTGCDKFAIGVLEGNNTHTQDWNGMITDVKYWNKPLTAAEVLLDYQGTALSDDGTYLQLHLLKGTYGINDQGLGDDDGTLTGHAYLNGYGSEWSRQIDLSGAVVADKITTVYVNEAYKRGAISAIVKAA